MVNSSIRLKQRWQPDREVNIHEEMTALTLAIVGKTLFDADVESETSDEMEAITNAFSLFHLTMMPFSELLGKDPFLTRA